MKYCHSFTVTIRVNGQFAKYEYKCKSNIYDIVHVTFKRYHQTLTLIAPDAKFMLSVSFRHEVFFLEKGCHLFGSQGTFSFFIYNMLGTHICLFANAQEVVFDKTRGTVSLMNSRFLEKHILGYRRKSKTFKNLTKNMYIL